jgi:hypothetical protein
VANSSSITPLPLDPELLEQLLEKLPTGVIEQLTDNWQKQSEALARSEKENRLLRELLRLMRVEKYGPASERLSDQQLELLEQEPGVRRRKSERKVNELSCSCSCKTHRKACTAESSDRVAADSAAHCLPAARMRMRELWPAEGGDRL